MAQNNISPNFLVPGSGYIQKLVAGTNVTVAPASGSGPEVIVNSAGAVGPPGPPGAGGSIAYHIDAYTANNQLNNNGPSLPNAVEFLVTNVSNGITIVNNDEIEFAYTGTYMIEATLNLVNNIRTDPVSVWLIKNGSNVTYSSSVVKVSPSSDPHTFSWLVTVTNPNDRFQIAWWSTDLTTKLEVIFITGTPSRPNVPSSSLQVWQVIYQGVGTAADLATVLAAGNSAGGLDINMNGNDITSVASLTGVSGADNFSLSPTQLLIANGTQLTNTQTANNITLLNFIPGVGGGVGRVDATADLGQAQLFLGCGVNSPFNQNTLRLTVAPSTGALMEHETIAGTNRTLTVRSEGPLNLQAGYNDAGATTAQPITMTSTGFGGQANPTLILTNTNPGGTAPYVPGAGVALEVYRNKPTAGTNGDTLFTQSVYGKDAGNAKQEYTRITHSIRANTAGVEDGSIEFGCFLNGVNTNFLQINGNDEQVNILKDTDMTNQNLLNVKQIALGSLTGFGTAGQVITSRGTAGGTTIYSNPNQTPAVGTIVGGQSINDTTPNFNFACGSGPVFTFVPVANNRYRVDFSVSLEGPNTGLFCFPRITYNSIDYFGDIYQNPLGGGNPFTSEPTTKSGLHYHSINFTDYFTIPFSASLSMGFAVGILTSSGSATVNTAKVCATISPCFD